MTLWNYMGWDNASTVAQEVVEPQRNYPRAMLVAAGLVACDLYSAAGGRGDCGDSRGQVFYGRVDGRGARVVGPWLALCVVLGGTINGFGMFNALMMSYTRVPYALAEEGLLPKGDMENRSGSSVGKRGAVLGGVGAGAGVVV